MRSSLEKQPRSARPQAETKEGWEVVKDPVLIKSNRYGIRISFDPDLPFDQLLAASVKKFGACAGFFAHAGLAVQF